MNGLEVLVGYSGTTSPTLALRKDELCFQDSCRWCALLFVFRRAAIWDERADHRLCRRGQSHCPLLILHSFNAAFCLK